MLSSHHKLTSTDYWLGDVSVVFINSGIHEEMSVLFAGHLKMPLRIILAGLCQFNLINCQPSLVGDNRKVKFNLKLFCNIQKSKKNSTGFLSAWWNIYIFCWFLDGKLLFLFIGLLLFQPRRLYIILKSRLTSVWIRLLSIKWYEVEQCSHSNCF